MGSNPCRKLSLLGFAHPVEGVLFLVQGVCTRMVLARGRIIEESQIVARAGNTPSRAEPSFEHFELGLLIYERVRA